jgi:hypothetical protein
MTLSQMIQINNTVTKFEIFRDITIKSVYKRDDEYFALFTPNHCILWSGMKLIQGFRMKGVKLFDNVHFKLIFSYVDLLLY